MTTYWLHYRGRVIETFHDWTDNATPAALARECEQLEAHHEDDPHYSVYMLNKAGEMVATSRGRFWWIDTFETYPGQFYWIMTWGENELAAKHDRARRFAWKVPSLRHGGGLYAFRLREVSE